MVLLPHVQEAEVGSTDIVGAQLRGSPGPLPRRAACGSSLSPLLLQLLEVLLSQVEPVPGWSTLWARGQVQLGHGYQACLPSKAAVAAM